MALATQVCAVRWRTCSVVLAVDKPVQWRGASVGAVGGSSGWQRWAHTAAAPHAAAAWAAIAAGTAIASPRGWMD
ncbi:hypothetical protein PQU63_08435 [Xanthomonas protegens]|uniref:Uncharacterized protein n=1 Tax=Xanthomonas protegens TaxID=3380705 RepID=A0ABU9LAR6_9XANT